MAKKTCEYGDFQTPDELARASIDAIRRSGLAPRSVVEPTCGMGAFVLASASAFAEAQVVACEINPDHLSILAKRLRVQDRTRTVLREANFFTTDWEELLKGLPEPILIVGNYPWVTSAALGAINSSNLPKKSNFQAYSGLDALMGKSNFDISEWMLLRNLDWLQNKKGAIAMLCKTAVARKLLRHCWKHNHPIAHASIFKIDAMKWFGAAVDACLFYVELGEKGARECRVYDDLDSDSPRHIFGFDHGNLVSDLSLFQERKHLLGPDANYAWRSGIKHDCAKVMELSEVDGKLLNGHHEHVDIEPDLLFPLLKSSDIGGKSAVARKKYMLVPQQTVGSDTRYIENKAPRTWRYLKSHEAAFAKRGSSIYKGKPLFSIFGVGSYSFSPWKVAISGFYKTLDFKVCGPLCGKPVVFDDTVYFLPCQTEEEANTIRRILSSEQCRDLINSLVFWDEKRPITVDLLKKISLVKIAQELHISTELPLLKGSQLSLVDAAE